MRTQQVYDSGRVLAGRRADVVLPLRRSRLARVAMKTVAIVCLALLALVALITAVIVAIFGHPLGWSIVASFFAALPIAVLGLTIAVGLRAGVAAGPRWIGVRVLGRWRVVDLDEVSTVRLAGDSAFPGWTHFRGPYGPGVGGPFGGAGDRPAIGGAGGDSIVLEDSAGGHVRIGVEALNAGLADVIRHGLAADAHVEPGAAAVLDQTQHELGSGKVKSDPALDYPSG